MYLKVSELLSEVGTCRLTYLPLQMGVHGMLGELPLANASLQALLAEPVDSLASLPGVTNA